MGGANVGTDECNLAILRLIKGSLIIIEKGHNLTTPVKQILIDKVYSTINGRLDPIKAGIL